MTFTFEEGYVVSALGTGLSNPKYTTPLTVDTQKPKIRSATVKMTELVTPTTDGHGTLTITYDSKIKLCGILLDKADGHDFSPTTVASMPYGTAYDQFEARSSYNVKNNTTTITIPYETFEHRSVRLYRLFFFELR